MVTFHIEIWGRGWGWGWNTCPSHSVSIGNWHSNGLTGTEIGGSECPSSVWGNITLCGIDCHPDGHSCSLGSADKAALGPLLAHYLYYYSWVLEIVIASSYKTRSLAVMWKNIFSKYLGTVPSSIYLGTVSFLLGADKIFFSIFIVVFVSRALFVLVCVSVAAHISSFLHFGLLYVLLPFMFIMTPIFNGKIGFQLNGENTILMEHHSLDIVS